MQPTYTERVNARSWILYSAARVAIFALILVVLLVAGFDVWISALVAALAGLGISLLVLRKPRESMAAGLAARRGKGPELSDDDAEDERLGLRKED